MTSFFGGTSPSTGGCSLLSSVPPKIAKAFTSTAQSRGTRMSPPPNAMKTVTVACAVKTPLRVTVTVAGQDMLHVVALITFKAKSEAQYLDPLGLGGDAGAGAAGVKVLGSVEIGFPLSHLTSQIAAASRRSMGLAGLVLVACLVAMFPLARFTTKPLLDLSRAALGIAAGDLRQDVKRSGNDEVADLARSFARMISELQAMLSELKEAAAMLPAFSLYCPLAVRLKRKSCIGQKTPGFC